MTPGALDEADSPTIFVAAATKIVEATGRAEDARGSCPPCRIEIPSLIHVVDWAKSVCALHG
jgi:hypothetical protein